MSESKENAAREGELIVQEARQQAAQILAECRTRTDELRRETIMLRKEKETYLARFRALAEAQIKFVDTHEQDFAASDDRMEEMASTMATGASVPVAPASFRPAEIARETTRPIETRPIETRQVNEADQDVWRDYAPSTASPNASAHAEPEPRADSPAAGWPQAPAADPTPETASAGTDPETDQDKATEQAVSSLTEAVEFASLGIPVQPPETRPETVEDEPQVTAPV